MRHREHRSRNGDRHPRALGLVLPDDDAAEEKLLRDGGKQGEGHDDVEPVEESAAHRERRGLGDGRAGERLRRDPVHQDREQGGGRRHAAERVPDIEDLSGPEESQPELRGELPPPEPAVEQGGDGVDQKLDDHRRKVGVLPHPEGVFGDQIRGQRQPEDGEDQQRRGGGRFEPRAQDQPFPGRVFPASFVTLTPRSVSRISTVTSNRPRGTSGRI